jgi:hypothetical protein
MTAPTNLRVSSVPFSMEEFSSGMKEIERNTRMSRPAFGPCIAADPFLDPDSKFSYTLGLNPNTMGVAFCPKIPFREIFVRGLAAGQAAGTFLEIYYLNGGWDKQWIPAIDPYGEYPIFGNFIAINFAASGAAINVFPFF